jgi:hypothetical protein
MLRPDPLRSEFATFFAEPTLPGLRNILRDHPGELRNLDFKAQWPEHASLSKHVLGMANSGGGCIVVGVEEQPDKTLDPVGMAALKDKADIANGIQTYLPNVLHSTMLTTLDFAFEESEYPKLRSKKFQVMFISYDAGHIPFVALRDGIGIREAAIYIHREGLTTEASYDDVQRLLNARIESGHSTRSELDLKQHLDQLRVLIAEIPKYRQDWARLVGAGVLSVSDRLWSEPNPNLPQRGF